MIQKLSGKHRYISSVPVILLLALTIGGCSEQAAGERFETRIRSGQDLSFYVVYEGSFSLPTYQGPASVLRIAQEYPKWRVDREISGRVNTSLWTGSRIYSCDSLTQSCEFTVPSSPLHDFFLSPLDPSVDFGRALVEHLDEYVIEELPSREILGTETECFLATNESEQVQEEICLTGDGIWAYYDATSPDGAVQLVAIDIGFDIPEGHFEPPYPAE